MKKCASLIDGGSIIIFPTDTVYGIGCDPLNDDSVLKLFKIKNRPLDKHLPILTDDILRLSHLVEVTEKAKILINRFWPGPLTLILKLKKNSSLTSRYAFDNTIAIRIPDNKCTTNLIQLTKNKLLVGTSANLSKHSPLTNLKDLNTCNLQGYDAVIEGGKGGEAGKEQIVDYGEAEDGSPSGEQTSLTAHNSSYISTIVDLVENNNLKIIREGIISKEKIFETLNEKDKK
ncbi:MAG TPA: L-threonylcarbamoyladenylate synthase [Candidatus Nitrosocosmicus sp.]